jgi:hypothetical protein
MTIPVTNRSDERPYSTGSELCVDGGILAAISVGD